MASNTGSGAMAATTPRHIRMINPMGMRVMIRVRPDSNVTDTGLYLPEGAKQSQQDSLLAEVLAVASAVDEDTDEDANISVIP